MPRGKEEQSNDILQNIKGVILLSLIDIPNTLKVYLGDQFSKYLELAEQKEKQGKLWELMPKEAFIHPVSTKTFLRYVRDNQEINFAQYEKDIELKKINNIY